MMKSVIALLVAFAWPALAQDQPGNQDQPHNQDPSVYVERIETPQGTVTVLRPRPHAQPSMPRPHVNPDPVPPLPQTPFLADQLGTECWRHPCRGE